MKVTTLVIVGGALVLAMLAVSAWAWPQIPADAQVPVHWGVDGRPDGYGPKWLGLLSIPALSLGIVALLAVIPRFEPRRRNLERSATAYVAIGIAIVTFLAALHVFAVASALGSDVDISAIALFGAGALFIVIGNFLGKTRSNWFFGIRTPWTLSSERSWTLTHRLGGWLFVGLGGLVLVATILVGTSVAIWLMLGGILLSVVGLFAYSYLVWRDDPARAGAGAIR
jgi:uncharacterized membrane protein